MLTLSSPPSLRDGLYYRPLAQNTPPEADFISNPRWYERLAMWTFWWSWIFISYQYGLYQGFLYLILWHIICAIFPTICWW